MGNRSTRSIAGAVVLAAVLGWAPQALAASRIVAVGDVHGAFDELVAILERARLIDGEARWIGGTSTLIQSGDLFDRGLQVPEVLDLLMRLQGEAAAAGGEVIVLLGNHEGMNLIGFYRDVNPDIYARFADTHSEKRRKQGFDAFKKYHRARAERAGLVAPPISDELKQTWMSLYPPGRIEYEEAFGPEGRYGRWLRTLPVAVLKNDTLFIHAGLGPALAGMSLDAINAEVASEIAAYDELRRHMIDTYLIPPHVGLPDMMVSFRELTEPGPELERLARADDWLLVARGQRPRRAARGGGCGADGQRPHAAGLGAHPGGARRPGDPDRHRHALEPLPGRPALGAGDRGRGLQGPLPGRRGDARARRGASGRGLSAPRQRIRTRRFL
ncbi:MAG: metallophosphoesterase [Thermoanaerobaculales bacterium]|nr:metallophosphoesterase [Thermoanaerobaculales bacterium]